MTLSLNPIYSHIQVFLLKTEKQSLPTREKLENNQHTKVTNESTFSEASGTKEEFHISLVEFISGLASTFILFRV